MTQRKEDAFSYTNRLGDTYYLHEGTTKKGRPRYFFAKTVRAGALAAMPDGFETSESINGVVSVRRVASKKERVPAADVQIVEAELRRHAHLRYHRAAVDGDAIVIYEPHPTPASLMGLGSTPFLDARRVAAYVEDRMARAQYSPVMKFESGPDGYAAYRITYRGRGGWSYPLEHGTLASLVRKLVRHVGTEEFFELM